MSTESGSQSGFGVSGSLNWLLGGAVGGLVGSLMFGAVLWIANPDIVTETIPGMYGLDPAYPVGWAFHALHGVVLGVVFGFLVTRDPILGTVTADVETGFIASLGPRARLVLAGFVYGLAVWVFLPVIALTLWVSLGGMADPGFPAVGFETLVGHLIYGVLLGALFSLFVQIEPEAEATDAPFEERSDTPRE